MTPTQIDLVQRSFAQVKPIAATAAELFYNRLFSLLTQPAISHALRRLFTGGDMAKQGQMLMSMIGAAVAGLRDLETLSPVVRGLGARHVGYGVQPSHYLVVGAALIWTLEQGLGDAFTPDVREAWTEAYALLSQVMQLGALEVEPA